MPPAGDHPAKQAAGKVGKAMGVQLLIGIDFIAVLFGELACHAQRLAVGYQKDTDGGQDHGQNGIQGHLRQGYRRQPLW